MARYTPDGRSGRDYEGEYACQGCRYGLEKEKRGMKDGLLLCVPIFCAFLKHQGCGVDVWHPDKDTIKLLFLQ